MENRSEAYEITHNTKTEAYGVLIDAAAEITRLRERVVELEGLIDMYLTDTIMGDNHKAIDWQTVFRECQNAKSPTHKAQGERE